jgi:hypothetical protein
MDKESKMKTLLAFLALVGLASVASADELTLRNGSSFSGAVREEGDRVTIETEYGTMTFKKIDVRSVVKGRDPVRDFEERARSASTVKELVDLAAWAREKGLASRADDLYRKVIVRDPDQPDARKALGYEKVDGLWLSGDELLTARGQVKVNGRWIPKEAAIKVQEQQAAERIEVDRLQQETRAADQRHIEEMARIALDRERLEIERRAAAQRDAELELYRQALLRDRIDADGRRTPGISRWYFGPSAGDDPGCTVGPAPLPKPVPVRPAIPPPARDYSPVPLTPPTILPLTPPSPVPITRSSEAPKKEEKKDDDRKR